MSTDTRAIDLSLAAQPAASGQRVECQQTRRLIDASGNPKEDKIYLMVRLRRKQALSALLVGATLVVVAVGAWVAFAGDDDDRRTTIDERIGAYGGVRFGLSPQGVVRIFGEPETDPGFAPAGQSPSDAGVPQSIPGGNGQLLKYDGVVFLTSASDGDVPTSASGGVYAFMVTRTGATTMVGVSIGDSMDEARGKYRLQCVDVAGGESLLGAHEFYPSCGARVASGRIWFGRDPIRSITLVSGQR